MLSKFFIILLCFCKADENLCSLTQYCERDPDAAWEDCPNPTKILNPEWGITFAP